MAIALEAERGCPAGSYPHHATRSCPLAARRRPARWRRSSSRRLRSVRQATARQVELFVKDVATITGTVPPRWRLPLRVLAETVLRVGEGDNLDWREVDLPEVRSRVRSGKTRPARRWVGVPEAVMAAVAETCPPDDRTPQRRVFPGFTADVAKNVMARAARPPGSRTTIRMICGTVTRASRSLAASPVTELSARSRALQEVHDAPRVQPRPAQRMNRTHGVGYANRMRRKWLAVLAAFALALSPVGIAGCGGEGGDDSPPAENGETGEEDDNGGGY